MNICRGQLNVLFVSPCRSNGEYSEIWGICDAGFWCALHLTPEWPRQFPCLPTSPEPTQTGCSTGIGCRYSLICIIIITMAADGSGVSNSSIMAWEWPGGRIDIKMSSYLYRKSHCGDKTILRPSYLHNGISYTGKMISLYCIRAQALYSSLRLDSSEQCNHMMIVTMHVKQFWRSLVRSTPGRAHSPLWLTIRHLYQFWCHQSEI